MDAARTNVAILGKWNGAVGNFKAPMVNARAGAVQLRLRRVLAFVEHERDVGFAVSHMARQVAMIVDGLKLLEAEDVLVETSRDFEIVDLHRYVGDANITVCNIAPHSPPFDPNHGVTFVVQIDWETPLNIVADITVLDKPVGIEPERYGTNFGGEGNG